MSFRFTLIATCFYFQIFGGNSFTLFYEIKEIEILKCAFYAKKKLKVFIILCFIFYFATDNTMFITLSSSRILLSALKKIGQKMQKWH